MFMMLCLASVCISKHQCVLSEGSEYEHMLMHYLRVYNGLKVVVYGVKRLSA